MKTYWISSLCVALLWLSGCDTAQQQIIPTNDPAAPLPVNESTENSEVESKFFVIDVRSAEEFAGGNVDGSINIPHTEIVEGINSVTEDKSAKIYFY